MKRRSFVKASLVTGSFATGVVPAIAIASENKNMEKNRAMNFMN